MTYDVTGDFSGYTGPGSPLYSTCQPPGNKVSIADAVTTYIRAGFQPNHITIGSPFYSYSWFVKAPLVSTTCDDGTTTITGQFVSHSSLDPPLSSYTLLKRSVFNLQPSSGGKCGNLIGTGPQYLYKELVENGYFKPQSGFRRIRDKTSQTVVLYNPTTGVFIP
jgi:GH18 family chitinase